MNYISFFKRQLEKFKNQGLYRNFREIDRPIKKFPKAEESTDAIMNLSIDHKKPVGNGIITCFNMKQAIMRGKKGSEAAKAVISVLKQ